MGCRRGAGVAAAFLRRHRFNVRQASSTRTACVYLYGDRNQYFKLATLLTHLGLILFLAGAAMTGAFGFETVLFVGEGQTAPVQPVGTPDNLLIKNLGFQAPQRPDGTFEDFRTDLAVYQDGQQIARRYHPRQRAAHVRRLRLPPEHLRAGGGPRDPRRRRDAGVAGPMILDGPSAASRRAS